MRGTMAVEDDVFSLVGIAKMNNPAEVSRHEKNASNLNKGDKIELTLTVKYNQRKVDIAYLKSAYLALFSKFGYQLILNPTYDIVRRQILNPNEAFIQNYRGMCISSQLPEFAIISSLEPIKALYLKIKDNVVVMPDSIRNGADIYRKPIIFDQIKILELIEWPKKMELLFDKSELIPD